MYIVTNISITLPEDGRYLRSSTSAFCCVQVGIAKHGLQTLLSTNYYFTDVLSDGLLDKETEQKLVWLCGGILSNVALHPNNRCPALLLNAPLCFFSSCPSLLFVLPSPGLSFALPCCEGCPAPDVTLPLPDLFLVPFLAVYSTQPWLSFCPALL